LEFATDTGPAGGFIFDENPNHATDGWRYLEAAPFDQSAGAPWGCFRTPIQGGSRHGGRDRRAEHARHAEGMPRARDGRRLCADLSVKGVRGWFLPS